jgi:hypothetical protein
MVRKPVNMRDAHKVAVDLMDKKKLLDKEALEGPQEQQDDDRLLKLAEKFASLVQAKTEKPVEIIDVEDVEIKENEDALHDQRQEGLQEGEREVQLETRDSPREVGTDSAPSSS